jgi:hypothetical protein
VLHRANASNELMEGTKKIYDKYENRVVIDGKISESFQMFPFAVQNGNG